MAQFTNQAAISYNGITVNSNIVTGEITEALRVSKTALTELYRTDDAITYVVALQNTGAVSYTDLTVTDDLGAYPFDEGTVVTPLTFTGENALYYVNGVLQAPPTAEMGPPLAFTGIRVPANGNAILIYRARVNEFAPLGEDATVTNTVTVTGIGLVGELTDDAVITANTEPRLTIVKALDPTTVVSNGEITYTFTIRNYGTEADESASVTLTDTFDPILDTPLTVTLNGTPLVATDYTYSTEDGVFATVPGVITVPAATYTQDEATGAWSVTPGVTVVTVSSTI